MSTASINLFPDSGNYGMDCDLLLSQRALLAYRADVKYGTVMKICIWATEYKTIGYQKH